MGKRGGVNVFLQSSLNLGFWATLHLQQHFEHYPPRIKRTNHPSQWSHFFPAYYWLSFTFASCCFFTTLVTCHLFSSCLMFLVPSFLHFLLMFATSYYLSLVVVHYYCLSHVIVHCLFLVIITCCLLLLLIIATLF